MIKTIIFDLGGVIVPFDFKRGYAKLAPLCGYAATEIPVRLRSSDLVTRFETGRIDPHSFVRELSGILELSVTYEDFCAIWMSIFLPDTLVPESLIEQLGERHRLVLLSNTNCIHFEMLREAYPLLRHFDEYVLSYQVGALKPSARIYQEAIARSNCRPEECFFTDDIEAYTDAARLHGIDAVQFLSLAQLESELRQRAVL